ncbi:MAG: FtsX-like permease family protein [Spirochaetales bacterium]
MIIFELACKNLLLQRKRYILMTCAIALGFFLMTVLSALTQGAIDTIRSKAARYFSGQICIYGFDGTFRTVENADFYIDLLQDASLPIQTVAKRSTLYSEYEATIFFNGAYVGIRRTIGVDFESEKEQLQKLPFIEGGVGNGLLVSRAITDVIGAHVGDTVIFSVTTPTGQLNTHTLEISGIFDELNLFGYSVYMDRTDVNTLAQFPPEYVSEIAVFTNNGASLAPIEIKIRDILSDHIPLLGQTSNRNDFNTILANGAPEGIKALAPVTIDAQLEEISLLLRAFKLCAYVILLVFMLITAIGIINTYRVIIYNRVGEIGTMRAMGIHKKTVLHIFLSEALILSIVASAIGFVLANIALPLTQFFPLTGTPAVTMFTEYNTLQYTIRLSSILLNVILIISSVLLAVWNPSKKAATVSPAEALRKL